MALASHHATPTAKRACLSLSPLTLESHLPLPWLTCISFRASIFSGHMLSNHQHYLKAFSSDVCGHTHTHAYCARIAELSCEQPEAVSKTTSPSYTFLHSLSTVLLPARVFSLPPPFSTQQCTCVTSENRVSVPVALKHTGRVSALALHSGAALPPHLSA